MNIFSQFFCSYLDVKYIFYEVCSHLSVDYGYFLRVYWGTGSGPGGPGGPDDSAQLLPIVDHFYDSIIGLEEMM